METVARAVRRSGSMGAPLPDIYPSLAHAQVKFRRGGTSLICGWPGAFKSTFALNMLTQWARKDDFVGLYVSADSDHFTVAKRCSAILTGHAMTKVDPSPTPANPDPYNPLRAGDYDDTLRGLSNVHWEFRPLEMPQLDERMIAISKMHGKMPDLVVIDNLLNMVANPTDYSGQMTLVRDLDVMARKASSHVIILHHTHENAQDKTAPSRPQAIWEIHGKVNQIPRLVLTLAAQPDSDHTRAHLMVACVKNTNGPADRTGREYTDYMIETANARVSEIPRS
jgi:hypothetical protein